MTNTGNINRKSIAKTDRLFMAGSVLCAVFAAVYEFFSHQVYSNFMIFSFLIPFLFGACVYWLLGLVYSDRLPDAVSRSLYNSGIVTLTVGSIFTGIIEIYGTTSHLAYVYVAAGALLVLAGLLRYGWQLKR